MKNNKNLFLTAVALIGIIIIGAVVYSTITKIEEDAPPSLSLAPGSTFKGMFTDPAKYWQYEEGDTCTHDVSLTSSTLKQGQHIYYSTEDLTFQDVLDRINCVPFNRIRILYPDPETKTFYSFPEAYYQDTATVSDPSAVTIKAFQGFIIESSKETLIGGINNENEAVQYIHEYEYDVTNKIQPNNIFDTGNLYGFVNDIESGWMLIPGVANAGYFTEYLNTSHLIDRIEKVYVQTGEYAFAPVAKNDGAFGDISFDDGYYMIWMKLVEAPELADPTADPTVDLSNCQGEDDTHACITDSNNPSIFIQTGDEACGTDACAGIEVSCHNIEGQDPNPSWGGSSASCADTTFSSNCVYRAVCEEAEQETSQQEVSQTEDPCGGADESHVCITGARDVQTSSGMMSENIFFTGSQACETINKTCTEVEFSLDGNSPWSELIPSSHTICWDRLPDLAYEGTIQGYIINGGTFYPYVMRAECQ